MKIQKPHIAVLLCSIIFVLFTSSNLYSQETNSHISGVVTSHKKEFLPDAIITAVHEPTKSVFITKSGTAGYFHLFNLRPGGPYTLTISYAGYETLVESNLYYQYSQSPNDNFFEFILLESTITLPEVVIKTEKKIPVDLEQKQISVNVNSFHCLPSAAICKTI
ncbi:MAG: carboxypeptidase regulatory-like domain-containing protein [Chitinophagaceae bacterium]|nr:carboxypeptidase regulatory-like domain-containing protein [Chitinophagaceae bacterium]